MLRGMTCRRAFGLVVLVAFSACGGGEHASDQPPPVPVNAIAAAREDAPVELRAIGTAEA